MSKHYNDRERRLAYGQHAYSAKRRGLEFTLTFEQWCDVWGEKFALRGTRIGQLNMCRTRDEGGYTPGNVRIGTVTENHHEKAVAMRVKVAQRSTRGYGNSFTSGPVGHVDWLSRDAFAPYIEDEPNEVSDTC